jgi:hypothetical protein
VLGNNAKRFLGVALALIAVVVAGALVEMRSNTSSASKVRTELTQPGKQLRGESRPAALSSAVTSRVAAEPSGHLPRTGARQASVSLPANGSRDEAVSKRRLGSQRLVNGVAAAKAIDWDTVHILSPIPRLMPAREAEDAVDAGFAPEWFERSLKGTNAISWLNRRVRTTVGPKVSSLRFAPSSKQRPLLAGSSYHGFSAMEKGVFVTWRMREAIYSVLRILF